MILSVRSRRHGNDRKAQRFQIGKGRFHRSMLHGTGNDFLSLSAVCCHRPADRQIGTFCRTGSENDFLCLAAQSTGDLIAGVFHFVLCLQSLAVQRGRIAVMCRDAAHHCRSSFCTWLGRCSVIQIMFHCDSPLQMIPEFDSE